MHFPYGFPSLRSIFVRNFVVLNLVTVSRYFSLSSLLISSSGLTNLSSAVLTVFDDKLWLIGGMDLKGNVFKDVWYSQDGERWILATDNPPWQARQGMAALDYKNNLWIIGRFNDSANGGKNDVWHTQDGISWKKTENDPVWLGREDHSAVVFKNKMWVLGGMASDWAWKNDIWQSVF